MAILRWIRAALCTLVKNRDIGTPEQGPHAEKCERGATTPPAFRHQILSLARLPIPPLSQELVGRMKSREVILPTVVVRNRLRSGASPKFTRYPWFTLSPPDD